MKNRNTGSKKYCRVQIRGSGRTFFERKKIRNFANFSVEKDSSFVLKKRKKSFVYLRACIPRTGRCHPDWGSGLSFNVLRLRQKRFVELPFTFLADIFAIRCCKIRNNFWQIKFVGLEQQPHVGALMLLSKLMFGFLMYKHANGGFDCLISIEHSILHCIIGCRSQRTIVTRQRLLGCQKILGQFLPKQIPMFIVRLVSFSALFSFFSQVACWCCQPTHRCHFLHLGHTLNDVIFCLHQQYYS